jgi:cytochrome b6-f complex iron-sulfur subunit
VNSKDPADSFDSNRRRFLRFLGKGSVVAAFVTQIGAAARAFFPNVLYEPPARFKLRRPNDYPPGFTFVPAHRLYVIRDANAFHVISAICTHLGCTVQWRGKEFDCPCHGSRYRPDGTVIAGPAPRPLPWFEVSLSPDGFIEVDSAERVARGFRFVPPKGKA